MTPAQQELGYKILKAYLHIKASAEYMKIIKESLHLIESAELKDAVKQVSPKMNYFIKRIETDFKENGITPQTIENQDELIFQVMDIMDEKINGVYPLKTRI